MLPVCRNFISFLRRTPLDDIISFQVDHAFTLRKATAWANVGLIGSVVHALAHIINSYKFAMADASVTTIRLRFLLGFLSLNFSTGPGITDWIMTTCLGVIVLFEIRKTNFE